MCLGIHSYCLRSSQINNQPCKTHGTCPECGGHGCYTEWTNGNGYCHQCEYKPAANRNRQELYEEEIERLEEKLEAYRGIGLKSVEFYGVTTTYNESGESIRRVYPYPHRPKLRYLPKDFSKNTGFTTDHLFGQDKFNEGSSPFLTIVEGEDDCLAAYEILGHKYPVVSLPSATMSSKLKQNVHKYIDSFDKILVATDSDGPGDKAAATIAELFPTKTYRVSLTLHKDAQEYLEAGHETDFLFAWKNAKKYVPEFDTSTPDDYIALLNESEEDSYLPTGIEAYDEEHKGIFRGHMTLITAPEGSGKTEWLHYLEHHLLSNYPDVPFACCHLEESKLRTTLAWASYDLGKNVTRKDLIDDVSEVEESIKKLTSRENAHLFKIGTDEDPTVLIDRVKYYARVFDCEYFFIEPIQDLAQQYEGAESTERFLSKIAVQLARIADDLNIGIIIIGHENDEGQVSDCRKLAKQASVRIRLIRDLENPDPVIRNTTTIRSTKNRPTAFVGYAGQVRFDPDTFTISEVFE